MKMQSASTETALSIDDVLTEILLKVPIKPLIRSKLVCKQWLSLISRHGFWIGYNPTPNPAFGFFMCIKNNLIYRYLYIPLYPNIFNAIVPSINLSINTLILHSCNGLLLCLDSDNDDSIYVYNPTTNLSCPVTHFPTGSRLGATLAFDPVISPHYKVVVIVYVDSREKRTYRIHVYSSETRSWSSGGEIPMCWWGVVFKNGVYWNGSVHWLSREPSVYQATISLRYHVETRVVHKMVTPRVKSFVRSYYFGESCGHLHFVEPVLPRFVVYEMKRDYSEWFVKYSVDLSSVIAEYRVVEMDAAYVLSFVRGENDEDSCLIMRIPGKAVKFNVVDGTSEKLCDFVHDKIQRSSVFGERENRFADEYGFDYVQSLCSV